MKKLNFLQKLIHLDDSFLSKRIFHVRLFSYLIDSCRSHYGFIPDIFDILFKYQLHGYLVDYLLTGIFPGKIKWKSIVKCSVNEVQHANWSHRINTDDDFNRFRKIIQTVEIAPFLKNATSYSEIRNSYFVTKLLTDLPNSTPGTCPICNRIFSDMYVHACCNCSGTRTLQNIWWDLIMENFSVHLFVELNALDEEQLYQCLLGKPVATAIDDGDNFSKLCHLHIVKCIAEYSRLLRYL